MDKMCFLADKPYQPHIRKTWYKSKNGGWTENIDEADWRPWCSSPTAALCVEMRHEEYWIISHKRYDDYEDAKEAMYDELFIKPAVIPCIQAVFKELRRQERRRQKAGVVA